MKKIKLIPENEPIFHAILDGSEETLKKCLTTKVNPKYYEKVKVQKSKQKKK